MIELRKVSYSYGQGMRPVKVLDDISFRIHAGEMVAIQGPSGSGKSTLLYLLGCLLQGQSGEILIDGQNIAQLSGDELAYFRHHKIGFIFQQFHLLPKASLLQNILLPTQCSSEVKPPTMEQIQNALTLAKQLGLGERLDHTPNELSGGQQQRVAIARALMNDAPLLLADEPTGNLDSKSSQQILDLLKELKSQGKTIVVITHDSEVAAQCERVIHVRDGQVIDAVSNAEAAPQRNSSRFKYKKNLIPTPLKIFRAARSLLPLVLQNLSRNRARTALNMLGVTIGIAAVTAMITLGQFTKRKILDSYAELGVNSLVIRGYPNWELKATDIVPATFRAFDWDRDLARLPVVFPEIDSLSPIMMNWQTTITYGGQKIDSDVRMLGVNEHGLKILNRNILAGHDFGAFHITNKSAVCIIGFEIAQRLFKNTSPIGKLLTLSESYSDSSLYTCQVRGVLASITSNKEWSKPNLQIYVPYTFFQMNNGDGWNSYIRQVAVQTLPTADVERSGKSIKAFFEKKYGKSGKFNVDSDSVLISQMRRFLNLFTVLLAVIAFISLAVGGIGITNMMLVSVSERFREIGLRKALGATDSLIRTQFLLESVVICTLAGLIGIISGIITYQVVIYGATRFVPTLKYEWVVDGGAILLSVVSIFVVGLFSGFFPALKAEKLQVIEALRSE